MTCPSRRKLIIYFLLPIALIWNAACSRVDPEVFLIGSLPPPPLPELKPPPNSRLTIGSSAAVHIINPTTTADLPNELHSGFKVKGRINILGKAPESIDQIPSAPFKLTGTVRFE